MKDSVTRIQTKASSTVTTWTLLTTTSAAYEPFGALKGGGLAHSFSRNNWGNDGRLASRRLYRTSGGTNLSLLSYSYDANDNIGAITDQLNAAQS